jgi:hypothetical protein
MQTSRSLRNGKTSLVVYETVAASCLFFPDHHASPRSVIVKFLVEGRALMWRLFMFAKESSYVGV